VQNLPDEFVSPRSVHEIDHFGLALYPNVTLEADKERPVIRSNTTTYRTANVEEWDALAEGVSVSDNRSLGRRPHINLDTSRTMGQDMSVSGCGRMSK
jgi:hypothetical protein